MPQKSLPSRTLLHRSMPAELQRTMSEFTKRKLYLACCSDTGHGPSGPTCDPHALYHMTLRLSLLVPTYYRYRLPVPVPVPGPVPLLQQAQDESRAQAPPRPQPGRRVTVGSFGRAALATPLLACANPRIPPPPLSPPLPFGSSLHTPHHDGGRVNFGPRFSHLPARNSSSL